MSNEYLLTPVGRLIQGNFFEGSDTDFYGKPRVDKNGNPSVQWYAGLAIPKSDPTWAPFWATLQAEAQAGFPRGEYQWNGFAVDGVTPDPNRQFAWKVEDGDGHKFQGKEGAAGCWIVKATTGFAPSVFNAQNQQILNPLEAVRGHFYQLAVTFKANGDPTKPGMFINLVMGRLVGFGQEIVGGPDAASVFGAAPAQLPQGASATPIAPVNNMPAMGNQAPQGQAMGQPMQQQAPQAQPMQQAPQQAPQQQQAPQAFQQPQQAQPMQQAPQQMAPQQGQPMQQAPQQMAPQQAPQGQYVDPNAGGQPNAQGYPTATMSPTNQGVQPATDFLTPGQ